MYTGFIWSILVSIHKNVVEELTTACSAVIVEMSKTSGISWGVLMDRFINSLDTERSTKAYPLL